VAPVVNVTVATPVGLVEEVEDENDPPAPLLLHVIIFPLVDIPFPFASVRKAVTVTLVPAMGFELLNVTTYFLDEAPGPVASLVPPQDDAAQTARARDRGTYCERLIWGSACAHECSIVRRTRPARQASWLQ